MIAVYSGTSEPRAYVDGPPHEQTRQFRTPVFDNALVGLEARMVLAARYRERSIIARARLKTVAACYRSGNERTILDAFDAQSRELLGL